MYKICITGTEKNKNEFPKETPIGMAYVPFQQWEEPYSENVAFEKGTIFPSLYLPFLCGEVDKNDRK